ncbi:SDR family oxidoreductase [Anaeromyxobacter dehalogenans]|uniref:Short-chain dehydrogenase/reductase SDR n=1 Tax=Anaeromyxobacter dehalogenans (strain 2CP-C) TaxID=290397 RepID=Q2IKA0_ANADE|nr:SDR family oxidoreductase [Anaeromyxobacter dehalogenans]ABC82079.1 short-chain dehydrogenase/reductase SDR [Anaeromyxobacter dehalogenans 2CP-C]
MTPVIVISGAVGALGTALAGHLVAHGYRVAGVGLRRHEERLRTLEADLGAGFAGFTLEADSTAAWDATLDAVGSRLGAVSGAALVAGGWRGGEPFHEDRDEGTWRSMLDENLESAQRALRALMPRLVAQRSGSVVVVGSRNVERPWSGTGAAGYTVAKTAVVALARVIAQEVLETGVRVNAVLPSTIDTPANRDAMPGADASRWVAPGSLSAVIEFLLSDAARDVSGAVIPVYGRA